MNILIYRSKDASFQELFQQVAQAMAGTLPFATKEEYLLWVEAWKKDYALLSLARRLDKTESRYAAMLRSEHAAGAEAIQRREALKVYIDSFSKEKRAQITEPYRTRPATYKGPITPNHIPLLMLVQRRAGKIQAQAQWLATHQVES